MDIGPAELVVVLAVVMAVFGPKKLPELARSLGEAIHAWRDGAQAHPSSAAPSRPEMERRAGEARVPDARGGDA